MQSHSNSPKIQHCRACTGRKLSVGEPCSPYTLRQMTFDKGKLVESFTTVYGRKLPLAELRSKLLKAHERFMRLQTDQDIHAIPQSDLLSQLSSLSLPISDSIPIAQLLYHLLAKFQRNRTLCMWHDHATILGRGFLMITVHVCTTKEYPSQVRSTKIGQERRWMYKQKSSSQKSIF